jgi:hypothetical protein
LHHTLKAVVKEIDPKAVNATKAFAKDLKI